MEVVTWVLCSRKENFEMLNRKDDNSAAIIDNPRSADFEVCYVMTLTISCLQFASVGILFWFIIYGL